MFIRLCFSIILAVAGVQARCLPHGNDESEVLRVGATLYNQSLDPYDPVGSKRRYLIDPLLFASEKNTDMSFEVRISFLGSPPAGYTMTLLRVPCIDSDASLVQEKRSVGRILLDTERIAFRVRDAETLPITRITSHQGLVEDVDTQIVVEVQSMPWGRRRKLSTSDTPDEPRLRFNIKLDPIVMGLPRTMLPVVLSGVILVLVAAFILTPRVMKLLTPVVKHRTL